VFFYSLRLGLLVSSSLSICLGLCLGSLLRLFSLRLRVFLVLPIIWRIFGVFFVVKLLAGWDNLGSADRLIV
jgi:hypothetical protein